jgi:hypothetical protein
MSYLRFSSLFLCAGLLTAGCGDDGGGGGGDAGGDENPCGFEDRYLPYQPGYQWSYKVTDILTGDVTTKSQVLAADGADIVQTTTKSSGSTVSTLRVEDDTVLRLVQEDRDQAGALERTTVYDPGQKRLDESPNQITVGATRDDNYTATITLAVGGTPVVEPRTDSWEVLGVDAECTTSLGSFQCLHVKRTRTAGGTSVKEYFFARGIGKVKEVNPNQHEELIGCE